MVELTLPRLLLLIMDGRRRPKYVATWIRQFLPHGFVTCVSIASLLFKQSVRAGLQKIVRFRAFAWKQESCGSLALKHQIFVISAYLSVDIIPNPGSERRHQNKEIG